MARITGIGGVFFKANDPKALAAWYQKHLGLSLENGAVPSRSSPKTRPTTKASVWSLAKRESQWFAPSASSFMINYRVDDMDGLLAQLRAGGVSIHQGPEKQRSGIRATGSEHVRRLPPV